VVQLLLQLGLPRCLQEQGKTNGNSNRNTNGTTRDGSWF